MLLLRGFCLFILATSLSLAQPVVVHTDSARLPGTGTTESVTTWTSGAGNLLVVGCQTYFGEVPSASDTQGDSFTSITSDSGGGAGYAALFYAKNIIGGSGSAACGTGSADGIAIVVAEVSGIDTSSPLDQFTQNIQIGTGSVSTGSVTTTVANEFIFAFMGSDAGATYTVGASFTLAGTNTYSTAAEYWTALTNSATSYTGTFGVSPSSDVASIIATFKPGSGSARVRHKVVSQ